ncbi:MAG: hypothetical protein QW474_01145 [Candidatus Aenigmatarchaeota archaeon]
MAYVPETSSMGDMGLKIKPKITIKNPLKVVSKVATAVATGGTSLISDAKSLAVKTITKKPSIKAPAPTEVPTSTETPAETRIKEKPFIDKKILTYSGIGLGGLLLILLITRK